jgi:hypothetical protein
MIQNSKPVARQCWHKRLGSLALLFLLGLTGEVKLGRAGVFTQPHFVTSGKFALGLEPEIFFSNGASLGASFHYTHGLTDAINLGATIGTGDGNRGFRGGARGVFEFFPDGARQPGLGVATSALFVRHPGGMVFELGGSPYVHKTFVLQGATEVEPFLSFPLGLRFDDGRYEGFMTVTLGSIFKVAENVSGVFEFGVAVVHTESYISGGVTYFH